MTHRVVERGHVEVDRPVYHAFLGAEVAEGGQRLFLDPVNPGSAQMFNPPFQGLGFVLPGAFLFSHEDRRRLVLVHQFGKLRAMSGKMDGPASLLRAEFFRLGNGIVKPGGFERQANGLALTTGEGDSHLGVEPSVARDESAHFTLAGIGDG